MAGKTAILVDGGFYRKGHGSSGAKKLPQKPQMDYSPIVKDICRSMGENMISIESFIMIARQSKSSYIIPCCNERLIFLGRRRVSG